ncbi:MAG: Tetratricopeptide repeat protein, partial [Pedosphaera sp.]|nr:Tetratricopeptide repeat protein [Pedosphaera sp.]
MLPWLLAAGMLAVYAITLNHWVSPGNVHEIARLSGLTWRVELGRPFTYLITFPLQWLPAVWVPVAANFLTALCAAGVLGLLARSVALLPHNRTQAERQKNPAPPHVLTISGAWLPPALAALACGFQLTFWEHAVTATSEMPDLLLFAYLVRCLLEYRVSEKKSWLLRWALVDGVAMSNNWIMAAFLPAFLAGWFLVLGGTSWFTPQSLARLLKEKLRVFDLGLLGRLLGCWLAGASLVLLMPLIARLTPGAHPPFWASLGIELRYYYFMLTAFPPGRAGLMWLTSVVPVIFIC